MELFPKRLNYAPNEPGLVLIDALYGIYLKDFCYLIAAFLLLAGNLAEFMTEKSTPWNVCIIASTRITNITSMKNLLYYCLNQEKCTHLWSAFLLMSNPVFFLISLNFSKFLLWNAISVLKIKLVTIFLAFILFWLISIKFKSSFSSKVLHKCLKCIF